MKLISTTFTLSTKYGILSILEDVDQECVHIWVNNKDKEPKIEIDCEHIQIKGGS